MYRLKKESELMQKLKILIADDDPATRLLLEIKLKSEDHDVDVAEDGEKAIELITENKRYDVVLTDLMMPDGISGIRVLETAKDINPNIEVILITAHSSINTAVEAMKKGAIDYLEKPINIDELFLRIEKIVNVRSIMKNAQDLGQAMDVTEKVAAKTIQNFEIKTTQLQQKLDEVEKILRNSEENFEMRVNNSLDIIDGLKFEHVP